MIKNDGDAAAAIGFVFSLLALLLIVNIATGF